MASKIVKLQTTKVKSRLLHEFGLKAKNIDSKIDWLIKNLK